MSALNYENIARFLCEMEQEKPDQFGSWKAIQSARGGNQTDGF